MSVCISEVSHCRSVLRRCLGEDCEGFLDAHQVVGYVAALARGLLPLPEVVLCLNEVGQKVCPGFFILVPLGPTVFRLLACLSHQSI